MTLAERYERLCQTPSSINEHLPLLRDYARRCESVAEFGVDIGQSTTAFLMGQPHELFSYDVVRKVELTELFELDATYRNCFEALIGSTYWVFNMEDSRTCNMPTVDLLFIDSSHCYDYIKAELTRHHAQVRRWLICHDIIAYGEFGEAGPPQPGINAAIDEFLVAHPEWIVKERLLNNNGLLIMERVNAS